MAIAPSVPSMPGDTLQIFLMCFSPSIWIHPEQPVAFSPDTAIRESERGADMKQKQYKIIVEKHPDGYVAYPLGMKGDTYEDALNDVKSAIRFHIETFGEEAMDMDPPVLEAFVAEAGVTR
jgi:hypothetical protein